MTKTANVYRVHGTESYRRGRFQLHEPSSCRKLKSHLDQRNRTELAGDPKPTLLYIVHGLCRNV